jgi:hypothetical protein
VELGVRRLVGYGLAIPFRLAAKSRSLSAHALIAEPALTPKEPGGAAATRAQTLGPIIALRVATEMRTRGYYPTVRRAPDDNRPMQPSRLRRSSGWLMPLTSWMHLNPTSRGPRLIGVSQHCPRSSSCLTGRRIHSETRISSPVTSRSPAGRRPGHLDRLLGMTESRRSFPPPWTVEETRPVLHRARRQRPGARLHANCAYRRLECLD